MLEYNREAAREARRRRIRRERMIGAGTLIAVVLGAGVMLWPHAVANAKHRGGAGAQAAATAPAAAAQGRPGDSAPLPGGRLRRGTGGPVLGPLGDGTPDEAAAKLSSRPRPTHAQRPAMPAMELLATIAQRDAEMTATTTPARTTRPSRSTRGRPPGQGVADAGHPAGAVELHDRGQVLQRWLREPDVGVALDPEWSMSPGEVPGTVIGSTMQRRERGRQLHRRLRQAYNLPQKLLIVHQFTPDMIKQRGLLQTVPGIAEAVTIDGWAVAGANSPSTTSSPAPGPTGSTA